MKKNKFLHMAAFVLVIVGGLNWGLVGFLNFSVVDFLLGGIPSVGPTIVEIIYALVGVSAVYLAVTHTKDCKTCSSN